MTALIRKLAIPALLAAFISSYSFAADSNMLGGSFIDDGIAARPAGLAGAYTAIADDGNAAWWNPAGVGLLDKRKSICFTYVPDVYHLDTGDITRMLLTYGQGDTGGFGGLGASVSYLNVNLGTDYASDTPYKWSEFVVAASWGMEIQQYLGLAKYKFPKIAFGVNVKYLGVSTDLKSGAVKTGASGFGADAGLMFAIKNNFNIGIMAKNIFTQVAWTGGSTERMPYSLNAGVFYGITPDFLLTAEVKSTEAGGGAPEIGQYCAAGEYTIRFGKGSSVQSLALRSGVSIDLANDVYIVPAGASLGMENFSIDAVYQFYLKTLLATDMYRLGITAFF
jgi:hypothetical protein